MARDIYSNVIAKADPSGALVALGNVQVTVRLVSSGAIATIYKARTGATQGPTAGSGALGNNPFTTAASGAAEFWADPGEYDVQVHDLQAPPRVADYTLGWNSIPGAVGGIPSDYLAGDAKLPLASLSAAVARQDIPIGGIIDWWRPSTSFNAGAGAGNPPPGFDICDGRSITEANHDFGAIGTIALPDLRNAFVLGADNTKANGTSATVNSNAPTAGPGVGGAGGAHSINVSLPAHKHGVGSLATVGAGSHAHGGATGGQDRDHSHAYTFSYQANMKVVGGSVNSHYHYDQAVQTGGASQGHLHGIAADGTHAHTMSGEVGATASGVSGDALYNTATQDLRPRYVGLLKIMKVKRI